MNLDFYDNQFTGFLVYNPKSQDTIFSYNSDKYFTPASNTKLITLYTGLSLLPDSIPAFKYSINNDTISLLGTGNPTFLHSYFKDSTAYRMVQPYKHVKILVNNLEDEKFGPGWAWEDYDTYFSPERSSFPMYGNVLTITKASSALQCEPEILSKSIKNIPNNKNRNYNENVFYSNLKSGDTLEVPMVIHDSLIGELWANLLKKEVTIIPYSGEKMQHLAYGIPSDSLYKRMMLLSDNFLAEQILIMSSSTLSDTLSSKRIRNYMLNDKLNDLKQLPRWVDGSGLSRYNLFTPTSFVQILTKLYNEIPEDRLFNLFPVGGKSGTLKRYYAGKDGSYIYAKSGTVGNNYSLSGYLITNSGETLIFSFMNNHYTKPTTEVKRHMESIFEWIRDHY
ncbi:D-alanyl-D-alanine carboxypeptidase [Aestuariibaculum sp. M13]|uniref:D-alanyl-D-alanine carboxypeptidase n=1 Tax=Aestuariibaculum sp. M13 TaxID=2967132 RepID=UPI002159EAB6|nr:D-alanyl-D-alanine carboxypeptidase [Aestuariibaculum sp. M13]MCR8667323.1 D-alanyl-D-alanine carboxypeptidase [Aestuariibaculum sp. M13]